jgi:murein DD-endopeptidase MepM/ murein hydrolase activator NlpD
MALGSAVLVAGWLGIASSVAQIGEPAVAPVADEPTVMRALGRLDRQLAVARTETGNFVMARDSRDAGRQIDMVSARHAFLAELVGGNAPPETLVARLPRQSNAATSGLAAPLAAVSQRQLAFAEQVTALAKARVRAAAALLSGLGLDPAPMIAKGGESGAAMGGPFIPASQDIEPRFRDLLSSWQTLKRAEATLAAIPAVVPLEDYRESSSFGRRFDPFNRRAAKHEGLDMAAPRGTPIRAAADGRVETSGTMSGYGNLVILDHGRGIETRYGHMSKLLVKQGDRVKAGDVIGLVGSTGRSTGNHLHYEVRLEGRPLDPKAFIEKAAHIAAARHDTGGAMTMVAAPARDESADR